MQNWLPWVVVVAIAALIVVPIVTYDPPVENGVTLVGRVVDAEGNPLKRVRVEAWQSWEDAYASPVNYWKIPGWRMRTALTDEEGYFRLEGLIDYPEMKSRTYYIVFTPPGSGWAHTGYYFPLKGLSEGDVVDWGTISVNRDLSKIR